MIDYGNLAGSFNRNRQQDAGLSWRFTHDGTLFGSRNNFVVGGFFGWSKSYGTVDNTLPGAEIGTRLNNSKSEAFNIEIFAEDRFALTSTLDLVVGGQFIHAKRRSLNDYVVPTSNISNAFETDASRWYTAFSPKVGLLWQPTEKQQFYANFSRSYEPPINSQLAFRDPRLNQTSNESALDAQEATTIEVGTRGRPASSTGISRSTTPGSTTRFSPRCCPAKPKPVPIMPTRPPTRASKSAQVL